jgi:hypothetical protein
MLKSLQLRFAMPGSVPKIFFDPNVDTLFLTFPRDLESTKHAMLTMNAESILIPERIVKEMSANEPGDFQNLSHLAVDQARWHNWAAFNNMEVLFSIFIGRFFPEPVFPVLPCFPHLKTFKIVANSAQGLWPQKGLTRYDVRELDAHFVPTRVSYRIATEEERPGYGGQCEPYAVEWIFNKTGQLVPGWTKPAYDLLKMREEP